MAFGTIAGTRSSVGRTHLIQRCWRRLPAASLLVLAFAATPVVVHAGFIDLDWVSPTTNADGSPLLDLASYRVYVATSIPSCPGTTFEAFAAPGPSPAPGETVAVTLTSLSTNATYWVRVSAVDASGNESACTEGVSGVARADINPSPSALNFGTAPVGTTTTMDFSVQNLGASTLTGTATSPAPFSIVSGGTLNVAPGASQVVRVGFTPVAEQVFGANVTFTTNGDQVSRSVSGTGVMATPAVLQFSQAAYAVTEGGAATITVTRTGGSHGGVTASYAVSNGTAIAGVDYTAAGGTLTFGAGVLSQTFTVRTTSDKTVETAETISLTLSNPQGGAILATPNPAILTMNDKNRAGNGRRGK
jgi:hypothetical protein